MAQTLTSTDIPSVAFATDAFGEDKGLLVCRPGRSVFMPFFTIPQGCYALVTSHGADVDYNGEAVWPAGLHYGFPWLAVSNLVTMQSVVFDMPVKGCKTRDNVTVQIDVAIVFRIMGDGAINEDPSLVRKFVHEVGARGLEQQLRGAQEEVRWREFFVTGVQAHEEVRALARTMKHTEVYGLRTRGTKADAKGTLAAMKDGGAVGEGTALTPPGSPLHADEVATFEGQHDEVDVENATASTAKGTSHCQKMKASLNRQFQPQGVMITAVVIKNVELPSNINEQMSGKTLVISSVAEQKMNQQSDMQQIVYNQEVDTLDQAHEEQREEEKQTAEQRTNEIQIRLGHLKAEAMKTKMNIGEQSAVCVKQIEADVALQTSRLSNSQDASVTEMRAKSEREAAKILAEADLYATEKASDASLTVARNQAESATVLADAEGRAAPMVRNEEAEVSRGLIASFGSPLGLPRLMRSWSFVKERVDAIATPEERFIVDDTTSSNKPGTKDCINLVPITLAAMKNFQTNQRRLDVTEGLAYNPDLVISSSSNDDVNAMMMCDAVLTNVEPGKPINRSQVLAELVMLQKGSRVYMGHDMAEHAGA